MSTDYSALLLEYPAVISKDQLYRICHISKRKATWLLENGIIPCRDSGKKTRRFQIYTADVVNYLITLENEPQKVAIPVGIFTSNKYRKKRENPVAHLPRSELKKHLCLKWRSEPDALTITQISKITGYNMQTVGQWISKGKLQYVSCPDGRKVAKRWLIQFMTDYILASPYRLSYTMRRIMEDLDGSCLQRQVIRNLPLFMTVHICGRRQEMANKFFEELSRCLRKKEIESANYEDKRLEVFLHGQPVLFVSPANDVFLLPAGSKNEEASELYHQVAMDADEVYSYVETMQNAPLLHASGLHEDFRLLADFGGAVLAGQERENGQGYQFVTWIWDYDRTGVSHGHYYEDDFQSAKQDFAVRSGLIPRAQLFTPEELTELYRAAEHWFYEGPELDYKQQKAIQEARTKIEYTVPDLQSRLEQAQSQEPQMNL